ncbi:hypothetical protein AB2B41_21800, partial [Marimonas sp. MJW-29]
MKNMFSKVKSRTVSTIAISSWLVASGGYAHAGSLSDPVVTPAPVLSQAQSFGLQKHLCGVDWQTEAGNRFGQTLQQRDDYAEILAYLTEQCPEVALLLTNLPVAQVSQSAGQGLGSPGDGEGDNNGGENNGGENNGGDNNGGENNGGDNNGGDNNGGDNNGGDNNGGENNGGNNGGGENNGGDNNGGDNNGGDNNGGDNN